MLRANDADKACFQPRAKGRPWARICAAETSDLHKIPESYRGFTKVFSSEESKKFPPARPWDHKIELKPGAPPTLISQNIRLSQPEMEELAKFIKEHEARGTIHPSKSPYAAAFFFIKKKNGKLHPVQDYRPVNEWTIKNRYPLPLIPQQINRLHGCTLITTVDILWGYNVVRIRKADCWKAAFTTPLGLYEPTVMFFGLTNSPATFQLVMNTIFREQIARGTMTIYMDDIAVHTKPEEGETEDQHLEWHRRLVKEMLTILEEHDLFVNIDKCQFEQESIEFLGVRVGRGRVEMQASKVDRVREWKPPRNVQEVRRFLGFTGYYRYFIKGYSSIAKPLIELTRKTTPWRWGKEQNEAFDMLRSKMCKKPVLQQPNFNKTFYLQTDASAYGVGAVLSQEGEGSTTHKPKQHPIAYYSATFTPTEQNYNIFEREFLGVKKALVNW